MWRNLRKADAERVLLVTCLCARIGALQNRSRESVLMYAQLLLADI